MSIDTDRYLPEKLSGLNRIIDRSAIIDEETNTFKTPTVIFFLTIYTFTHFKQKKYNHQVRKY